MIIMVQFLLIAVYLYGKHSIYDYEKNTFPNGFF